MCSFSRQLLLFLFLSCNRDKVQSSSFLDNLREKYLVILVDISQKLLNLEETGRAGGKQNSLWGEKLICRMSLNCLLLPEKVTFENVIHAALNVIFSND